MRLRLNTTLRAALIAAITAVGFTLSQAQATAYNGVEYSGNIFTIENNTSHTYHDATYSNWYYNGEQWTSSTTWTGTATSYYEGETQRTLTGTDNSFWRRMFGDASGGDASLLGNTLRLHNASGTTYYEAQFSPFRLGGVIVEEGDATYIVGRKNKECAITLQARTGASANMSIGANTILSVGTAASKNGNVFTVASGGTWTVATGKTLSIGQHNGSTLGNAGIINFNSGANVTMNGGGTIDLSHTNALNVNSLLTIGENTIVKFANTTTLSCTITNAGTVNFGDTVSVEDFSGFKGTAEYSNEGNGFVVSAKYTLVEGDGTVTGLTRISHGGSMLDVDQTAHTVSVTDADYTAYYLNTANASVVVDDAAAEAATHQQTLTTVNVKNTGTTVTVNSEQELDTLSIAEGMGTTVNGTGTLAVNSNVAIGNGGSLAIASGSTLKVANAASAKALMMSGAVTNNGTFELACDMQLDAGVSTVMAGALKVDSGATLKLSNNKGNPTSIASFSSVELAGGNLWANTTMRTINALSVTGDSQISFEDFPDAYDNNPTKFDGNTLIDSGKTLTIYTNYKSRVQIAHLTGAGTLKLTTANRNDNGENVTIDTLEGFSGNITLAPGNANNPVRVTAALGNADVSMGVLSLNDNSATAQDTKHTYFTLTGEHNLTLKGIDGSKGVIDLTVPTLTLDTDSNHSYTGALAISGQLVKTGEGSQTISGYVMSRAMDVQAGTLVLNGTYSIDGITDGSVVTKYFDDKGVESLNGGFKEQSGTKTVYSVEDGASVNTDNAHFTYGGSDVTDAVKVGGTYVIPSSGPDYTTLHVIAGELSLAPYQQKSQDEGSSISNIVITADAKLVANNDYTGALSVIGEGTGLLEIFSGNVVSLSSQDQDLELSGQGTYALGEGTTSMGNVTLGDDWSGIVRITNATANNLVFGNLAKDASAIEMKGYTGWSQNWYGNITQNIILTDNGDSAAWSNGAFTSKATENPEAVFSGEWSGTGTFKRTGGNKMNYKFTGDISDWDGKFMMVGGGTTTLSFAGNATDVKAAIDKDGNSTLNVVVGDGEHSFTTTFNDTITANSLTVQANANATFTRDLDVATITVNADGTMNMTDGMLFTAITNNGTVSLTDITLNADGFEEQGGDTAYFDLAGNKVGETDNHYLGADETYVQVVNGGTVSGSGISWKDGTYDLKDDGRIVVNQGGADYGTFFVVDEINASAIAAGLHYADTQTIDVGDMATLNIDTALAGKTIVTHEYSYITGAEATPEAISLAAGGSTFFSENVTTTDGITFSSNIMGVAMANTNEDGAPVQYSTAAESIVVQASEMTNNSDTDVTVANKVDVSSIENNGTGKLILTNVYLGDEASLASIAANTGDITLKNVDANPVELENLTIALGQTVAVYQGDEIAPNNEGTVTISDTLAAGGGTLLANLTLVGGSMLDVDGGDDKALTLGSTLTIDLSNGGFVNLDQATIDALNSLQNGERLDLIVGTPTATLDYAGNAAGAEWYNDLFYRPEDLVGDYKVYTEGGAFGLEKQSSVPEPTTGTLSLLALAALAARRRRK